MSRAAILFFTGCAVAVALLYGAYYRFGPESAAPSQTAMRQYRLSQLSDADLKEIVEKARKDRARRVAQMQAAAKEADARQREEYAAREKILAQCDSDPVFKLRNENLCRPAGGGFIMPGPVVPYEPAPSEEELIEGYIMGPCSYVETVREARKQGCLLPK